MVTTVDHYNSHSATLCLYYHQGDLVVKVVSDIHPSIHPTQSATFRFECTKVLKAFNPDQTRQRHLSLFIQTRPNQIKAFKPVHTKAYRPVYTREFKPVHAKAFKLYYANAFKPYI